jgi:Uma2 family endonuclease
MADVARTRMTAAEFFELPETTQITELIDGELIVSPSPIKPHQDVSGNLYFLLRLLHSKIGGTVQYAPMDVHLDDENVTQPDVFWVSDSNEKCKVGEDNYWHGPPDLIVEILSPGTTRQDKVTKFALYERHGVREYWIADPKYKNLEVWSLVDGKYTRLGLFSGNDTFISTVLGQTIEVKIIFGA